MMTWHGDMVLDDDVKDDDMEKTRMKSSDMAEKDFWDVTTHPPLKESHPEILG